MQNLSVRFSVTASSQPGDTGYVSSENLLKPSKRKNSSDKFLLIFAEWLQ